MIRKGLHILLLCVMLVMMPGCRKPGIDLPPPAYDPEQPAGPETPEPPAIPDTPPEIPGEVTYTLMSYNVGAFKKYYETLGHYSYPEVADIIWSAGAKVVGLNETDWGASRSGGEHQAEKLADQLGTDWESRFYPAGYTWYGNSLVWDGATLLAVKEYPRLLLPKTEGSEVRSMGAVEFPDFTFCVTHLDHVSEADRLDAVGRITGWASANYGNAHKPVFLVGDMNAEPESETILKIREDWRQLTGNELTFSTRNLRKCIDFIFVYKNGAEEAVKVMASGVVTPSKNTTANIASDHCPYWATLTWDKSLLK